jgi:hypothetical protein
MTQFVTWCAATALDAALSEAFASPCGAGEPGPGDHPGAFCFDVVAALSHLTQMINQRLQFWPSRC